MQDSINFRGIWFLPSRSAAGIPGFLTYIPKKGIELELMGLFDDDNKTEHRPELINGITADGKEVTLYKCFRFHRGFNSNSFETSSYDALYMFIGNHFSNKDELRFEKIACVLADFDLWVGAFGFKKIESNDETRSIMLEYERPLDLSFPISDSLNLTMWFSASYPVGGRISAATIKQVAGVNIESAGKASDFEQLLKWFQTFYGLMTLSYFTRTLIHNLWVSLKKMTEEGEEYTTKIEVYFRGDTTTDAYRNIKSNNFFLFSYPEIKDNFQLILQRWFTIDSELEPTVAGLTESFMRRQQLVEFKFLNLAQAIETFHRRTTDASRFKTAVHQNKIEEIISDVRDEYRQWLKVKLQFSHEPTLKQRLEELVEKIPEPIGKILLVPTTKKFMNHVRDSRNYYTHYDVSMKSRALKGKELFILSERMKILLVCLVLKEIGFTDKEVINCIFKKGVFLFNHIIKYEEVKKIFKEQ